MIRPSGWGKGPTVAEGAREVLLGGPEALVAARAELRVVDARPLPSRRVIVIIIIIVITN
jgi:hypothetical protein